MGIASLAKMEISSSLPVPFPHISDPLTGDD